MSPSSPPSPQWGTIVPPPPSSRRHGLQNTNDDGNDNDNSGQTPQWGTVIPPPPPPPPPPHQVPEPATAASTEQGHQTRQHYHHRRHHHHHHHRQRGASSPPPVPHRRQSSTNLAPIPAPAATPAPALNPLPSIVASPLVTAATPDILTQPRQQQQQQQQRRVHPKPTINTTMQMPISKPVPLHTRRSNNQPPPSRLPPSSPSMPPETAAARNNSTGKSRSTPYAKTTFEPRHARTDLYAPAATITDPAASAPEPVSQRRSPPSVTATATATATSSKEAYYTTNTNTVAPYGADLRDTTPLEGVKWAADGNQTTRTHGDPNVCDMGYRCRHDAGCSGDGGRGGYHDQAQRPVDNLPPFLVWAPFRHVLLCGRCSMFCGVCHRGVVVMPPAPRMMPWLRCPFCVR